MLDTVVEAPNKPPVEDGVVPNNPDLLAVVEAVTLSPAVVAGAVPKSAPVGAGVDPKTLDELAAVVVVDTVDDVFPNSPEELVPKSPDLGADDDVVAAADVIENRPLVEPGVAPKDVVLLVVLN